MTSDDERIVQHDDEHEQRPLPARSASRGRRTRSRRRRRATTNVGLSDWWLKITQKTSTEQRYSRRTLPLVPARRAGRAPARRGRSMPSELDRPVRPVRDAAAAPTICITRVAALDRAHRSHSMARQLAYCASSVVGGVTSSGSARSSTPPSDDGQRDAHLARMEDREAHAREREQLDERAAHRGEAAERGVVSLVRREGEDDQRRRRARCSARSGASRACRGRRSRARRWRRGAGAPSRARRRARPR